MKLLIKDVIKNKIFILVVILIVFDIFLGIVSGHLVTHLPEQLGADRWGTEKKMSQVSLFFTEDQLIDSDFIIRHLPVQILIRHG